MRERVDGVRRGPVIDVVLEELSDGAYCAIGASLRVRGRTGSRAVAALERLLRTEWPDVELRVVNPRVASHDAYVVDSLEWRPS